MPALMRMLAAAAWLQLTRPLTSGDVGVAPPDASQVVPYFSQHITFVEAENLTTLSGDWAAMPWAHSDNYFAATIANVFHSRRAYLRGPANASAGGVAAASMLIADDGD